MVCGDQWGVVWGAGRRSGRPHYGHDVGAGAVVLQLELEVGGRRLLQGCVPMWDEWLGEEVVWEVVWAPRVEVVVGAAGAFGRVLHIAD